MVSFLNRRRSNIPVKAAPSGRWTLRDKAPRSAPYLQRWATKMRTLISLLLVLSISITASAGILPQEHREQFIQAAFANFWGKARLSNGNPVQPENAAERSTLPISTAAANHVISVGELSGIAEWCGMDWQAHFLSLTAKARRQGLNEKQVAFIGLLHGISQGNVYSAVQSKPCTGEQKSRAAKMLETSPVKQAIPQ